MVQQLQTKSLFLYPKQDLCFLVEPAEDLKVDKIDEPNSMSKNKTQMHVNMLCVYFYPFSCLVSYNIFLFFKNLHVVTSYSLIVLWSPVCTFILISSSLFCSGRVFCLLPLIAYCLTLWVSDTYLCFLKIFFKFSSPLTKSSFI